MRSYERKERANEPNGSPTMKGDDWRWKPNTKDYEKNRKKPDNV